MEDLQRNMKLTFNELAQFDHIFFGALIVVYSAFLGHATTGLIVALVFAALKEFVYDRYYEDPATRGSDWEDFFWYCVGISLGEVMIHYSHVFQTFKKFV